MKTIGVLLSNIGTPAAPTAPAVRRYLNEFLSDKRVIGLSPWLWQPILKILILPWRSRTSAKLYQKIWTDTGSPLLTISQQQAALVQEQLQQAHPQQQWHVSLAMRYGTPSIEEGLTKLKAAFVDKLIILPLFPHYSATTTASTFDAVSRVLRGWRNIPTLKFINHYYNHPDYIHALTTRIQDHWKQRGRPYHLLFSFHGIPKEYVDAGDPYSSHCHKTALLVAEQLQLKPGEWSMAFQSRFGSKEWLQPYCVEVLKQLPNLGIKNVDVICPGFAADCLETLEEIAKTNRAIFMAGGGEEYHYIPALNASKTHIHCLSNILAAE